MNENILCFTDIYILVGTNTRGSQKNSFGKAGENREQ